MAPFTKEQIIHIAKCKGSFVTSPRWRDDRVRKRCFELLKEGIFSKAPRYHKYNNIEFVLTPNKDS